MNFDDSSIDSLIERVWIENIDGYHQKALEEWGHPLAKLNILDAPYEPSNILKNNSGLKILWVGCDMCHQRFKDHGNLFRHKARIHQCDQPCSYCRKPIDNYDEFLDHLKTSHNVPYRCSSCSAVFDERRLLEAHYDLTHGDGLAKFCFRCGKLFSTLQSYNRHCQFVHEQPKPVPKHSCKYCNQSFATVQALKIHSTRKHTG
ncbi:unnamed protein product [Hymenolepis diminuta]|uniref:C2H2-type domain-containing protein n=1 Tax=Hymenolepis diminuta TaxID=6216 RepID=A0A564ZA76_HYMDI|nr:unnamed protein product [Hymenolepis diminuta]